MAAEDLPTYCICDDDWTSTVLNPSGVFETLEEAFQCGYPVTKLILRPGVHKWPPNFTFPPDTTISLHGGVDGRDETDDFVLDIGEGINLRKGQKLVLEGLTLRQGRNV